MKKGLIDFSLFIVPIFLFLVGMEVSLRSLPNSYSYKMSWMQAYGNKVELLILGNSQSYFGIQPAVFDLKAFNLSHVSQMPQHDLELWNTFKHDLRNIKWVIVPLPFSMPYDLHGDLRFTNKNYVIYYGLTNRLSWQHTLELTSLPMRSNFKRLFEGFAFHTQDHPTDSLGFGKGYEPANSRDLKETSIIAAKRHAFGNVNTDNLRAFNELLTEIHASNINILVITLPLSEEYRAQIPKQAIDLLHETAINLEKNFHRLMYLDWSSNPSFTSKDFYDSDHLNSDGAEKLSTLLSGFIRSSNI
ncbi:MAG: hypothetical protein JJU34_00735 [Lunatimonas sp.]|uniref:hypothetical protein n=1 Tax=Lunatimonas sp. TaxID=2060141 RepID=UPI00263A55EB|nr:hypothetical protein [Lunatimonas sp.]MCC5935780.1 hypothetical protein [Lunatimonas sp.]